MMHYAFYPFALGFFQIGYENEVLLSLKKVEESAEPNETCCFTDTMYHQLEEYIQGKRKSFDIPFSLQGTAFQKKVWHALCQIPYGETRSYQEIAIAVNSPKACRAVGNANNKNPIALIVPCHRVIGSKGDLVGYAGGLAMKKFLLDLEKRTKKKEEESSSFHSPILSEYP